MFSPRGGGGAAAEIPPGIRPFKTIEVQFPTHESQMVNRLEDLSLPRNTTNINWPARHDLVVDWAVKSQ